MWAQLIPYRRAVTQTLSVCTARLCLRCALSPQLHGAVVPVPKVRFRRGAHSPRLPPPPRPSGFSSPAAVKAALMRPFRLFKQHMGLLEAALRRLGGLAFLCRGC